MKKKKCLIYVVCYDHEKFILSTLKRIPKILAKKYKIQILIADDKSKDNTIIEAKKFRPERFKFKIMSNYKNQGYGGNQKIGYYYAIKNNFDYVVLLHGDGQYAPEHLPRILNIFKNKKYSAVFGSRMMIKGSALKGGMPLYKFVGNKILSFIQNFFLNTNLSEFHSGYRAYRVQTLKEILFELNSDDYCSDTQIIIQIVLSNFKIREISIPTFYGEEISYVNGIKYAFQIIYETIKSKFHFFKIIDEIKFHKVNNSKMKKIKQTSLNNIKKIFNKSKFYN